jgi:hypothetical protein
MESLMLRLHVINLSCLLERTELLRNYEKYNRQRPKEDNLLKMPKERNKKEMYHNKLPGVQSPEAVWK